MSNQLLRSKAETGGGRPEIGINLQVTEGQAKRQKGEMETRNWEMGIGDYYYQEFNL